MAVNVKSLARYKVADDGRGVSIDLIDDAGRPLTLNLDVEQLGLLVMTLPGLIERALRNQYHDASLRYSYPIGSWIVEQASDPASLIVTLRTTDQFGISFTVPRSTAAKLGNEVAQHANSEPMIVRH